MPSPLMSTIAGRCARLARLKVAVHVTGVCTFTVPLAHSAGPDHPENTDPGAGVAVNATAVPGRNVAAHTAPQLIPPMLVMVPTPSPARATVSSTGGSADVIGANSAVHVRSPFITTTPLAHSPSIHRTKRDPANGSTRSVTAHVCWMLSRHTSPQLIPLGVPVIRPSPSPAFAIFSDRT